MSKVETRFMPLHEDVNNFLRRERNKGKTLIVQPGQPFQIAPSFDNPCMCDSDTLKTYSIPFKINTNGITGEILTQSISDFEYYKTVNKKARVITPAGSYDPKNLLVFDIKLDGLHRATADRISIMMRYGRRVYIGEKEWTEDEFNYDGYANIWTLYWKAQSDPKHLYLPVYPAEQPKIYDKLQFQINLNQPDFAGSGL